MDDTKSSPNPRDYHKGQQAAENFQAAVKQVLSVSYTEMKKRDEEWKKQKRQRNKR